MEAVSNVDPYRVLLQSSLALPVCRLDDLVGLPAPPRLQRRPSPNIVVNPLRMTLGGGNVGYHCVGDSYARTLTNLPRRESGWSATMCNPTCSPTRAGLLTGGNPSRFGIHAPIAGRSEQSLPVRHAPRWPAFSEPAVTRPPFWGNGISGFDPRLGRASMVFDQTYGYLHGQLDQYTHLYKKPRSKLASQRLVCRRRRAMPLT
jgi:hypothetical protein